MRIFHPKLIGSTLGVAAFFFIVSSLHAQDLNAPKLSKYNPDGSLVLLHHVPREIKLGLAHKMAHAHANQLLDLRFLMPSKNPQGLETFVKGLYDRKNPNFHKFLTPDQFNLIFGASSSDSDAVLNYLKSIGMQIKNKSKDGYVISATGTVASVESAFKVHINNYKKSDGTSFFGPDADPIIPPQIAGKMYAIAGMDNTIRFHPHFHRATLLHPLTTKNSLKVVTLHSIVSSSLHVAGNGTVGSKAGLKPAAQSFNGFGGSFGPSDITAVYNLNSVTSNGSGQTLGLFELDGYNAGDINGTVPQPVGCDGVTVPCSQSFEAYYGLPNIPLTNILTDSFSGAAGENTDEVVLDIDLAIAVAPGLSGIRVYEAEGTEMGWIDQWQNIAGDINRPNVISDSWGGDEPDNFTQYVHAVFATLASEGVTVFASSGDAGAYDNCDAGTLPPSCTIDGNSGSGVLSVDDPGSDPNVTSVGISVVTVTNPGTINEAYASETASLYGGGGISSFVNLPTYQTTAATSYANATTTSCSGGPCGSTVMRNVPDVSFTADPDTVYGIFVDDQSPPGWYAFWGSSAAAPIWAAFTTRINEGRVALGGSVIGQLNPDLYLVEQNKPGDFHDVATGNNSYYPAIAGYDAATGIGSFNGANLYNDLIGLARSTALTPTPGNTTVTLTWTAPSGSVSSYNVKRATVSGGPYTTISTSGAVTTTNYVDTGLTDGQIYYYVVSAVNTAGIEGANSTEANATPTLPAPSITAQPSNATVTAPATANFTITATGASSYQWKISTDGGSTWNNVSTGSGGTTASYTTPATDGSFDGNEYECIASNGSGSTTSNAATLTVDSAPIITTQPSNETVTAPATAVFTVVARGEPVKSYQWQVSTDSGSTWNNVSTGTGGTTASYTTAATDLVNNGNEYQCIITNINGTVTSNAGTLTVITLPNITAQPANDTVTAPAAATFTVAATGSPAPTYQWQISTNSGSSWSPISGATGTSYTTPATSGTDNGSEFECIVSNTAGNVTSTAATLTVDFAPSITTQPSSQTVSAPGTATFTVVVAANPSPTYQWQQSLDGGSTWSAIGGATGSSYTTPATSSSNNGNEFECVITNGLGSPVTTNPATLTVTEAPSFATQPVNQTVTAPATATFTVAVNGIPTPTLQWQLSTNGGSSWSPITGATNLTYTTPATTGTNNGYEYECVANNTSGSATSNAVTLTVDYAPTITIQPANQTVGVNATATFTVVASGNPTPTYQWQDSTDNGSTWSAIGSATSNSYTTPANVLSNTGTQYECVLTNMIAAVTSSAATLTVTPLNPPTNLNGTLLGARVGGHLIYGGAQLTWVESTSPNVVQNKIYRSTGSSYVLLATVPAATSYVDKTSVKGVTYDYEVTACDSSSAESVPTSPVSVSF